MSEGKHAEMVKKLISKKRETGYDESAFAEEYWTAKPTTKHLARIDKDASQLINYFNVLFGIMGHKGTILDVGAGAGSNVSQMKRAGFDTQGCEFSASGRKLAKERFGIEMPYCDLRDKLPYEDNAFDWAYCVGVLSMIPIDKMEHAVKEIFRVIKKGVLINVETAVIITKSEKTYVNPHHLTALPAIEYWKIFKKCKLIDATAILPPQKLKFGIGLVNEFSGLFLKGKVGR